MVNYFQGPYTMPKGASGRVPPTSGGTIAPAGPGVPRGALGRGPYSTAERRFAGQLGRFQKALQQYGGAYAALANLDPAESRRAARRADAFLTQYNGPWERSWWEQQWAKFNAVGVPPGYSFSEAGWTNALSCAPDGSRPYYTGGVYPPPSGWAAATPSIASCQFACQVNMAQGVTIPAGATSVWLSKSNLPYPAGGGNRTYEKWTRGTASTQAIPWSTGTVVLPEENPWEFPWPATQMETAYGPKVGAAVGLRPYQVPVAAALEVPSKGPPNRPPNPPPHNRVPPKGEKEDKRKANYGTAGWAYGMVTEFQDFLGCAMKSIHGAGRPPKGSPIKQSEWVAANWRKMDIGEFIECAASQHVFDELQGAANRNIDRRFFESGYAANTGRGFNGGRPSGIATGPLDLNKRIR